MLGFSSPLALGLVVLVIALGSAVQASIGFGLALLTAPLLEWVEPRLVPGPLIVAVTLLLALTALRERDSIDIRGVGWILLGRVPGTALGALSLGALSARSLTVSLGLLVLLAVGISLSKLTLPRTPWMLSVAGVISGLMGTTAALGGPAVAILYQDEKGAMVRSTLAVYFLIGAFMSLSALALIGRLGAPELLLAVGLVPGMALGFWLSRHLGAWLDRGKTRYAVLLLSALGGVSAVIRGLS